MLITIKLDNEHSFKADEVCNVWSNGLLPPEFEFVKPAITQGQP